MPEPPTRLSPSRRRALRPIRASTSRPIRATEEPAIAIVPLDHLQPIAQTASVAHPPAWTGIATAVSEARSACIALDGHASALCVDLWPALVGGRLVVRGPGGLAAPWLHAALDEPNGLLFHDGEGVPVTLALLPWTTGTRIERAYEQRYLGHPRSIEVLRARGTTMEVRPAPAG